MHTTQPPIPQEVIDQVHILARNSPKGLEFLNRSNEIITDIENDPVSDNTPTIGNNNYSILVICGNISNRFSKK